MAMTNMLTIQLHLDSQPGGVSPELHLKEGCTSVAVELLVMTGKALIDTQGKYCVVRGILPDGTELFIPVFSGYYDGKVLLHLYSSDAKKMATVPGEYKCTMTILNTTSKPTRANYMNYDYLTVLPFTVIVHEKARRDEDA